jgi:serine/threonine protein kinase
MEIIGSGAFSTIYKTTHNDRVCVIKNADNKDNNRKFLRNEVNILNKLKGCKYSVQMLDYKISRNGYIKYELLDETLEMVIDELTQKKREKVIKQLKLALDEIHSRGVIHADLKLDNIMFDFNGNIKLIDFGNAVLLEDLNTTTQNIGISCYRSPEYIIGAPLDKRVDYWAYGCIVYEILTKECLFNPHYEGDMSKNACLLGIMILILGDFNQIFLESGKKTHKYFDINNNYNYLFSYLLDNPTYILELLNLYKIQKAEYWSEYICKYFKR